MAHKHLRLRIIANRKIQTVDLVLDTFAFDSFTSNDKRKIDRMHAIKHAHNSSFDGVQIYTKIRT